MRIISNGNVITWDDVCSNLALTGADGVMSAEGILDDPTLFLPSKAEDAVAAESAKSASGSACESGVEGEAEAVRRKERRLRKKLREVAMLEASVADTSASLSAKQQLKVARRHKLERALRKVLKLQAAMQQPEPTEESVNDRQKSMGMRQGTSEGAGKAAWLTHPSSLGWSRSMREHVLHRSVHESRARRGRDRARYTCTPILPRVGQGVPRPRRAAARPSALHALPRAAYSQTGVPARPPIGTQQAEDQVKDQGRVKAVVQFRLRITSRPIAA